MRGLLDKKWTGLVNNSKQESYFVFGFESASLDQIPPKFDRRTQISRPEKRLGIRAWAEGLNFQNPAASVSGV
jgi:hypothetical protein